MSAPNRRHESITKCLAIRIGLVITSFVSFKTNVVLNQIIITYQNDTTILPKTDQDIQNKHKINQNINNN